MYVLMRKDGVDISVNIGEAVSVPVDPANTDYQQYLAWLAEGNTPEVITP